MRKILFLIILSTFSFTEVLDLSSSESNILKRYELRCLSTGTWAPLNLLRDSELIGIGLDYWKLITQKLGIEYTCREAKNWTQVLREIKNKTADVTITSTETDTRLEYASFTKPYVVYPIVIVTKGDIGFVHDIGLIENKTLAIGKNYSVMDIVKKHYPELKVIEVKSAEEALEYVEQGKAFATIDILPVMAYKLEEYNFRNLKISGSIPYVYPLSIMVRKDYSEVIPIINKAIDTIKHEEKNNIYKHWIHVDSHINIINKYMNVFIFLVFFSLFILSFWLYRLIQKISRKTKIEKQLKKLAFLDSLTGVFNRYALDESLDREIIHSEQNETPLSIIFMDLDHFKQINDSYGHKVGDTILQEFSTLIQHSIRNNDVFGRWGGDEFLLVLPNTKEKGALKLLDHLNTIILHHQFSEHIRMSCCFGVATYVDNDTRESMIERGDEMLYKSKRNKEQL